jgi:ATP-dependent helicase/nuclease subunit A
VHIAPSRRAHAAAADAGDPDGRERGIAIHTLLDHLTRSPRPEPAALRNRLAGLLMRDRDDPVFADWWQHALAVVQDPRHAALFDPGRGTHAWNEVPVQYLDGARLVHGIIDRLVLTDDAVTVIDYKTHARATPATLDELVADYRGQMQCYAAAVRRLWPGHRVRACLLFTACAELVELDGLQSGV